MKTLSTTITAIFSLVCVAHVFAAAGEYDAALPESVSETVQEAVETVSEKAPAILDGFRKSILSNWRRLSGKCVDLIALHDEMSDLPEEES